MSLADWRTTALCLAAVCAGASTGLGALFGAAMFAPVIYALARLRAHAPNATSTATLVAATCGPQAGGFTKALQVTGYALVAVESAQSLASLMTEQDQRFDEWPWSLSAAAVVVVAALVASVLPDGAFIALAALLALAGVATYLYFGTAVAVHVLSETGTAPLANDPTPNPPGEPDGLGVYAELAQLGLAMVAFEVATTRLHRVRSLGRSMGLAMAVVVVAAAVVWYATGRGGNGAFGGYYLAEEASALFGPSAGSWLHVATVAIVAAGLLAVLRGAFDVLDRGRWFAIVAALAAVATVAAGMLSASTAPVGEFVLIALYIVILVASCRIPGGDFVTWWLRALTPIALLAVVVIPAVTALKLMALLPVAIATWLVVIAAIVGLVGTPSHPG